MQVILRLALFCASFLTNRAQNMAALSIKKKEGKFTSVFTTIYATFDLEMNLLTQEEMLQRFQPLFRASGRIARKTTCVWVRPAQTAEYIETRTSDGLETANIAQAGDLVVRNTTQAGECYLLAAQVVQKRYAPTGHKDGIWEEMAPTARTQVLQLTSDVLSQTTLNEPFHFMARWQEPMIAKMNDYLAMPLDGTEIYRIAAKEFDETYQFEADTPLSA